MADVGYHFLSWVRSGFAASIAQPDTFGSRQPALATAPVGVTVSGAATPIQHNAAVRGPGDVIGISPSQVVRTDPIDGAVGVEPNYFAQIEFDRPDLPWLFTPAAAVDQRLRPWIVLVVLDAEGPAACSVLPGSPLPVIKVSTDAATELPDLTSSHLWTHTQVIVPDGMSLDSTLAPEADPRLTISRLMCPRHLSPNRSYIAAVVPAFNVGRLAGLGLPVTPADEGQLQPAWTPGAAVDLPVYYSWRFRTGEDADFESLARKLVGRPLPLGVGTRPLDVSRPGAGLPALPPPVDTTDRQAITWLDGALRPIDSDTRPTRDATATQNFQTQLTVLLDQPANLVLSGHTDPVVAPPIYGGKHALAVTVDIGATTEAGKTVPPWIRELNLDPRIRVAAGLGTQVIQARQEDYAARAWRQLGDIVAANRLLRSAQFARTGSLRVHARLSKLDAPSLLGMSYPAHERLVGVTSDANTLARGVRSSRLPDVAVEPAFRRLTRGSTAVGRAAGVGTLAPAAVERFAAQVFSAPTAGPDGTTNMRPASEVLGTTRSVAVLGALGDAQPSDATRLDTMVSALNASQTAFVSGDALRSLALRSDVGSVAVAKSLGAVQASAVTAVLNAAAPAPAAPPPTSPPVSPTLPGRPTLFIRPRAAEGTFAHIPTGLAGAATTVRISPIITPVATPVVTSVAVSPTVFQTIDPVRWTTLQQTAAVPVVMATADPISDPGARLNVLRSNPTALSALAQVVAGNVGAAQVLDQQTASLVTSGAALTTLTGLTSGHFVGVLPTVVPQVTGTDDLAAAREMVVAVAGAIDRMVSINDSPPPAAAPALDLARANTALLNRLDPNITVAARLKDRLDIKVITGVPRRDELDVVMACPQFNDPMWQALRQLDTQWLLPGLQLVPPDTATLVRTNPVFVAAHLIGLNHEIMRELLWREYPTDQRGTAFHRFWGRSGPLPDDIGAVHLFHDALKDTLLTGQTDEAVLLVRSELLRRYPGSIIYLSRGTATNDGQLQLDATPTLPTFRGDLPPDVTFVGFPVSPDDLRATTDPWWFVIAQPLTEPRFGLDDGPPPSEPLTANNLTWGLMSPDSKPDTPTAFALGTPPLLNGKTIDGVHWGDNAAVQARLTYQHPVQVAIRAADLMPPKAPPT